VSDIRQVFLVWFFSSQQFSFFTRKIWNIFRSVDRLEWGSGKELGVKMESIVFFDRAPIQSVAIVYAKALYLVFYGAYILLVTALFQSGCLTSSLTNELWSSDSRHLSWQLGFIAAENLSSVIRSSDLPSPISSSYILLEMETSR